MAFMIDDWVRVEPITRLRTINRVLDCIVPESPDEAIEEAIEIMLKTVARGEMTQAVTVLEDALQANPFWLRGYLLLATIYQYGHQTEQAITVIEKGLAMCTCGLRLFRARGWVATVKRITGPVVRSRISHNTERLRRYEGMFQHRLAMLRIHCGSFDEALEHWAAREDEHCAS